MSIRAIAHAIQAGETSIGWAIGAESMSLKYVDTTFIQPSIIIDPSSQSSAYSPSLRCS